MKSEPGVWPERIIFSIFYDTNMNKKKKNNNKTKPAAQMIKSIVNGSFFRKNDVSIFEGVKNTF